MTVSQEVFTSGACHSRTQSGEVFVRRHLRTPWSGFKDAVNAYCRCRTEPSTFRKGRSVKVWPPSRAGSRAPHGKSPCSGPPSSTTTADASCCVTSRRPATAARWETSRHPIGSLLRGSLEKTSPAAWDRTFPSIVIVRTHRRARFPRLRGHLGCPLWNGPKFPLTIRNLGSAWTALVRPRQDNKIHPLPSRRRWTWARPPCFYPAPMFVTNNSSVFTFFGEVCFNSDPFDTLIHETRQKTTRVVKRGDGGITPYIGIPASK